MKIPNIKSYFTTPYKCFIPKCKAHCCINVPLPENFYEQNKIAAQRPVFSTIGMTNFAFGKPYKAEICNTAPAKQVVGFDKNGDIMLGIPSPTLKAYGIKNEEDLKTFLKNNEKISNYCPFITSSARCSVYDHRPPICREFGTMPGKINHCPDKASRIDILKFYLKELGPVGIAKNLKTIFKLKFKNA